jgi:hypothetical protein
MPCDSSHMQARPDEIESRRVAQLLSYILECLGLPEDSRVEKASDEYYGDTEMLDEWTARLCEICGDLSEDQEEEYLYDGRKKMARQLADWWEAHQEQDARRRKNEEAKKLSKKQQQDFAARVDEFMETEEGRAAAKRFLNGSG